MSLRPRPFPNGATICHLHSTPVQTRCEQADSHCDYYVQKNKNPFTITIKSKPYIFRNTLDISLTFGCDIRRDEP